MATLTYTGELVVTSCWCGIQCAIPRDLHRQAHSRKNFAVFCPLGHEFVYGKNETDRQRERADAAENAAWRAEQRERQVRDQLAASERSKAALKGHLTRYRKRIANGVCPVEGCKRHFPDVQAHVATKHPAWLEAHPEVFEETAS